MYHESFYRVSYGDTDQMGVVYYANYLEFFERARTEMLRSAGMPYAEFERRGWFLPVSEAFCKYHSAARYDDYLRLRTSVPEISRVRVRVATEIFRDDELLVSGYVVLGSVNAEHKIVRLAPEFVEVCRRFAPEED